MFVYFLFFYKQILLSMVLGTIVQGHVSPLFILKLITYLFLINNSMIIYSVRLGNLKQTDKNDTIDRYIIDKKYHL